MYFASPDLDQVTKFNPKMQNLNVFWTWPEVKGGIFSIGLQKKLPSGWKLYPYTPIASGGLGWVALISSPRLPILMYNICKTF